MRLFKIYYGFGCSYFVLTCKNSSDRLYEVKVCKSIRLHDNEQGN